MSDCIYCGSENADIVCEECNDVFCRNCIRDGLCPICGVFGPDEGDIERIPVEDV
jgi:hypothetical protein